MGLTLRVEDFVTIEQVVEQQLWGFLSEGVETLVKHTCGQLCYSAKHILVCSLQVGSLFCRLFGFAKFQQSGHSGLPPSKNRHCLHYPFWECAYLIGTKSRVSSGACGINNE